MGVSDEIDEGVGLMKSEINEWEDRNNDAKEAGGVRVSGTLVSASAGVSNGNKTVNSL